MAAGMQTGEAIGCFGLTSRASARIPAPCDQRPKAGRPWVLNGEKTWITNGSMADIAVVWARTEEGIRGFLVERGTPGYTTRDIHGKLSMRASVTSSLHLPDCAVPEDCCCRAPKGLKGGVELLTQARFGIGWGVIGAAMDCYETARSLYTRAKAIR